MAAHPQDLLVGAILADVRQQKGDLDGATQLYETLVEVAPGDVLLVNNLAVLYQIKGNPKAMELAEKAYELAPKAAPIKDTYGWILFEAGQFDRALVLLREAAAAMPDNAEVQYHLAAALVAKGQADEARALLKKALNGKLPDDKKAEAQKLLQRIDR